MTRYVTESPFRAIMLTVAVAAATAGTVSLIMPTHQAIPAICMTAGFVAVAYAMEQSGYTDSFVAKEIVARRFARILICCGAAACVASMLAIHVI